MSSSNNMPTSTHVLKATQAACLHEPTSFFCAFVNASPCPPGKHIHSSLRHLSLMKIDTTSYHLYNAKTNHLDTVSGQ
jgi:hypothetical protein